MESHHDFDAAHWDHEPVAIPLTRPSDTLSPSGEEGWGEGARFMERGFAAPCSPSYGLLRKIRIWTGKTSRALCATLAFTPARPRSGRGPVADSARCVARTVGPSAA